MMGCIWFIISTTTIVGAAIIANESTLSANLSTDTIIVNIGETKIQGVLQGYENEELLASYSSLLSDSILSEIIDPQILENPHFFPLMPSTTYQEIDEITIIPNSLIDSTSITLLDLLSEVIVYEHVTITINQGIAVMITSGKEIDVTIDDPTLISAITRFSFDGSSDILSFISISESKSTSQFNYNDKEVLIYPYSNDFEIMVHSSSGVKLWDSNNQSSLLLLESNEISFSDISPIHAIPITGLNNENNLEINIIPSKTTPNISKILENIQEINTIYDTTNIPYFSNQLNEDFIFNSISSTINGAILLYNTTDDVIIDQTKQQYNQIGLIRINTADIFLSSDESIQIQANIKLAFLGDHFYSQQAQDSETGVSIPIYPIMFWIFLLIGILIFKLYLKEVKLENKYIIDKKHFQYAIIIIHVLCLVLSYVLIDGEIQYKIGNSLFQETMVNGFTLIAIFFLIIQSILWIIGYLSAALPLGILVRKIMAFIGFDTSYQHLGKAATSLMIWPIATIYITLMINIILLFFNPIETLI